VNLLVDNIDNIKKNTGTLINVSKEVGLEVNVEKNKYMLLHPHCNSGKNHDMKMTNRSFRKCGRVQIFGNDSKK
jgi:hypothetical protein